MSMPVMNGLDAARVMKRLMPKVPLIVYCAFGDRYVEQQVFLLGVSSVISKSEPVATVVRTAACLLSQTAE
jgi:DNA-binding NarL/FixJ family response regulator